MTYLLQVGIPDALGFIVRMADIVADMRRFAAEFTYSAHESFFLSHKGGGGPIYSIKTLKLADCGQNNKRNVQENEEAA
jgi:hypothetical protein